MRHRIDLRAHPGVAGVVALLASVMLAYVAQRPAAQPGLVDAFAPVLAIAAHVGGTTAAAAGLFGLRLRGVLWTAAGCVLALVLVRCAVAPDVALATVGRLPDGLFERWTAVSNSLLWFVAVPLEVVFGAASCGAVLAGLLLAGGEDARAARAPARAAGAQWSVHP
jgi:hypothetical protein